MFKTAVHLPSHDAESIMPTIDIAAVTLLAAAGLGLMFSWRRMRLGLTDALAAFTALWVAYNAACVPSYSPKYDELAQAAMLYVVFRIIFSAEKRSKTAIMLLLFCFATYESVLGIKQVFGLTHSYHSLFRVTGTLFNPGPYAGFTAAAAVCAAAYVVIRSDEIKHLSEQSRGMFIRAIQPYAVVRYAIYIAAVAASAAAAVILPATMSRAAWIASGCAIVLLVMFESSLPRRIENLRSRHRLRTLLSYMLAAILPILAIGIWAYHAKRPSADGRMLMWKIDMRILGDNPLHGVGIGNFAGAFGSEQAEYFAEFGGSENERQVSGCPEVGFNDYLQFGAETGVVGMAALAATVLCAIAVGLRRRDPCGYGLVAYAVFAMFSYPLSVAPLRLAFVILLAASASHAADGYSKPTVAGGVWGVALVGSLIMWPSSYRRSEIRAEARDEWRAVRSWMASERYDYIVEDGRRLYDILKYDFRFLYDYGYALHKTGDYSRSNEILEMGAALSGDPMFYNIRGKNCQALERWKDAEECYLHAHRRIPSRIYPIYLLTMMYVDSEQYDKAVATARKALGMTIKVESEQTAELKRELREVIDAYN